MVPYWELIKFLPPLLSLLWRRMECQKFYNRCEALGKYLQRFPMERLRLWFGRETLELLRTMLAACGEEKPWALLLCRDKQEIKDIINCKWTELYNRWPQWLSFLCMYDSWVFLSVCECFMGVNTVRVRKWESWMSGCTEVLAVMSWNVKGSLHEY